MNWIKLTPENVPTGEVLAANFTPGQYGYREKLVGYVSYTGQLPGMEGEFIAQDEHQQLNATHYVDLKPFDL